MSLSEVKIKQASAIYRCPAGYIASCSWKGSFTKMACHFQKTHTDLLINDTGFSLDLLNNSQSIFFLTLCNVLFQFECSYEPEKKVLDYCVGFSGRNKFRAHCELKLTNLEKHAVVIMEERLCQKFASHQNLMEIHSLDMHTFMEPLKCPDQVKVEIGLRVVENAEDSVDDPLEFCHRRGCVFLGSNAEELARHKIDCPFKQFICIVPDCVQVVERDFHAIKMHYGDDFHNYEYFGVTCSYGQIIDKGVEYKYFTIVDEDVVVIKLIVFKLWFRLTLDTYNRPIPFFLRLQHGHCNSEVHEFYGSRVYESRLVPRCFMNEPNVTIIFNAL